MQRQDSREAVVEVSRKVWGVWNDGPASRNSLPAARRLASCGLRGAEVSAKALVAGISRRPRPPPRRPLPPYVRGGARPPRRVTGRGEEEERGEGGLPLSDRRWPVCSGVGRGRASVPSPPLRRSRIRPRCHAATAGPAPRLPPRSARTAKRCPFAPGRIGAAGCHVVRGETSPLPRHCSSRNNGSR